MAEVGVLQLTIEDNSESAATGLSHLATALEKVQEAIKGGLSGLGGAAKNIEKIGKAVNDSLSGSTFEKLKQFSESLQGLKDVDLSGVSKAIKSVGEESGNPGKQISESLVAGIEEGMSKVDLLREKVGILRGEMDEGIDKNTFDDKKLVNYAIQIVDLETKIEKLDLEEQRAAGADEFHERLENGISTIGAYGMKLHDLRLKLNEGVDSGKWDNGKIASAVLQIQNLEDKIAKLREAQSEGVLTTTNEEAIQAANSYLNAATNIDLLKQKLDAMKAEMGQGILSGAWDEKKLSSFAIQVQNLEEKIRKLSAAAEEAKPNLDGVTEVAGDPGSAFNEVEASVEGAASSTGTLSDGMVEVEASVEAATGSAHRFADALDFIKTKAKGAWSALTETRDSVNGLKGAFSAMFPTLSTFLSGMGRIAKYRLIRTIIKQITSGMSEGIQNVYHYSKAIGSSFAPAMDSAATALLQMKNSIGAALAPMIQSLIPYLQIVINWFINLINYVNQFVSLLRGQQTWTRAVPKTTQAFEDQTKAAKKAGAAIKDLLADWDELNIIQSESGGGGVGAGTSAAEDYLSMFEEVGKYEGWIKNLVDGINNQFGDVWGLVKKIGLAILGWKLSSVFTGWLGLLGGLGLIDLEFNISAMLNNQYLDTGEIGWLIADVLQALVGGVIMKKLLGNVLEGKLATYGIPIMLTVNALARVFTLLGKADVSALSEKGLISNVVSALELGGVAGYLINKTFNTSATESLLGGAAATLIAFGALTTLKADVDAIRNGEIDEDTIKATALGSLAMSVGAAIAAKMFIPGVSTIGQAAGFGLATGAAAALVTLGATLGITASTEAVESGITTDVLLKDVASSLSMGLGGAIIIKTAGLAETWPMSAAAGGGVALVTLGALVGVQATIEAVQNKEITFDTIVKDAISSLLMGGGVALIAGTLCGLGAGAALTVGGVAALTTLGALIGIQAILSLVDREDKVKWGDEVLTEKEVQDYVNTQVFDVKLPVAISLVKSKMEDVEVAEKELEGKVGDVLPVINTLLLGFDTKGSLIELDKEIFGEDGLIKKYNSTISNKKAEIEAALVLVPIKDKEGNDMSAEYLKGISEGWSNIDNIMSNLGKSLTDTMYDSYSGQLKTNLSKMERETIADLTQTMLEIATIMSSSETEVNMKRNFAKGLGSLSGGSIDDIVKFYQSQKEIDIQAMKDTYDIYLTDLDEQKLTNEKLLEKALKNGGEYAGKSVEYYRGEIQRIQGLYNQVVAMQDDSVKAAMKFYTNGEGIAQVRKAIMDAIVGSIENTDISSGLVNVGKEGGMGWTALFDMKGNYVDGAKDAVKEWMNEIIRQAFPEDAKYILDAIDAGIIGYGDLFNDEVVKELTRQLGFNEPDVTDDLREKWNSLLADIFGDASETPTYENEVNVNTTVNETMETVTEDVSDGTSELPTGGQDAVEEYQAQAAALTETAAEVEREVNTLTLDKLTFNTTDAQNSASQAAWAIEDMASRIIAAFRSLDGLGFTFSAGNADEVVSKMNAAIHVSIPAAASGAVFKSGDIFSANENGQAELIGSYGNKTAVMNNDQVVGAVTNGVAQANSGVESRLDAIENKLIQMLNREWVAKAEPGAKWGQHNVQSAEAYSRVTG